MFESLKEVASSYLTAQQLELLTQAFQLARQAHEGQKRSSGEPYITHPLAVSRLLAEMHLDHETLMAAVLHDVIEDTEVTKEQLEQAFGPAVADLVEGVSKLDKLKFRDRQEARAENFRKMIMAMVKDIRVILIKLADRTHNMRTLDALPPPKRRRIAKETLEIFAPIANRLGIHTLKRELEELGFKALHPLRYRVLEEAVQRARSNRKDIIQKIETEICGRLEDAGIPAKVGDRGNTLFSIYNKMKSKELPFHAVMDIYAFRILVDSVDTCYRVLGQMHSLYKPRPGRFKDYIAIPKGNGYQSLHTSLVGPRGVPVEIQIRTEHMEQMAERGVIAHWSCKDNGDNFGTTAQIRAQRWMQSLLELQQSAGSSFEFIENVKTDLFPEEIYVFTPKGRILDLPVGATPVDFAYEVHTDIGHNCIGARVDRQPYPLSRALETGQTVEIITASGARPNAAWLNFVATGKARGKIRQMLKKMRSNESVSLGRRLLEHALGESSLEQIPASKVDQVLADLRHPDLDTLLAEIGLGNVMSIVVAQRLLGSAEEIKPSDQRDSNRRMPIRGADGMLVSFANCCLPIPGDPVVAHINPGKGLVIHLESCPNVRDYQQEPDRYLPVEWDDPAGQEYRTEIRVDLVNHQGALAKLATIVANHGSNIHNIVTEEKDSRVYQVDLVLTTQSLDHLSGLIRRIQALPDVLKAARLHR